MFSTKLCLSRPIKLIKLTVEVPLRTSSHLATIVSCALQLQDGRFDVRRTENVKIFNFAL